MTIRRGGSIIAGAFGELPSQTGQSGKYLTTNGSVTSWSDIQSGSFRNIGEIISSTIPLSDAGLHLLDGSVINGSGSYADFVDYIASIYDASANYFCTEAEWQQSVTDYGVCEKFVYDSVNNTVRLPKYTSEHGDLIKSYKSGTNWYRIYSDSWCEQGGQFINVATNVGTNVNFTIEMVDTNYDISLVSVTNTSYDGGIISNYRNLTTTGMNITSSHNAGNSSYWDAATVRWSVSGYANLPLEVAARVYEYIVIATSTKTSIQVDIDEIATDLNNKVDTDLSNINASQTAKETIVGWSMPDYSTAVSRSWDTSYLADKDTVICYQTNHQSGNNNVEPKVSPDNSNWITLFGQNAGSSSLKVGGWFFCPKGWYWKMTGGRNVDRALVAYIVKGEV